jgi:CDP-glucose 4,6-dehydratase
MFGNFFQNKKIFITGHTGFKGSWLCVFLKKLGANICGYSLAPPSEPSLFEIARVSEGIYSFHGDVRDFDALRGRIGDFKPDIIIHMAAQSLVRKSYKDPIETYSTNVLGTAHLFEAIRQTGGCKAVINVTSDKCYENKEWARGYRENDPMGGYDPYSSSKGCAEFVTTAYRQSFFCPEKFSIHGTSIASVRAGNVIGGGDFGQDRLIPDCIKASENGLPVLVRYPEATRPWQHVLDCLYGYLLLAKKMYDTGPQFSGGWNFGPPNEDVKEVSWMVDKFSELLGIKILWAEDQDDQPHEAKMLKLDCSKSRIKLGWTPVLNVRQTLKWTANWYAVYQNDPAKVRNLTENQIKGYLELR